MFVLGNYYISNISIKKFLMYYDSSDKEILENDYIFKILKYMINLWVYIMNCKDFIF